ncbi:hypothetical protein ES705_15413 [subsurface metagenome]
MDLIAKLFGVISPYNFDMGNVGLYMVKKFEKDFYYSTLDKKNIITISLMNGSRKEKNK